MLQKHELQPIAWLDFIKTQFTANNMVYFFKTQFTANIIVLRLVRLKIDMFVLILSTNRTHLKKKPLMFCNDELLITA